MWGAGIPGNVLSSFAQAMQITNIASRLPWCRLGHQ